MLKRIRFINNCSYILESRMSKQHYSNFCFIGSLNIFSIQCYIFLYLTSELHYNQTNKQIITNMIQEQKGCMKRTVPS